MAIETSTRALLVTVTDDTSAAVYSINRLKPEFLCFFIPSDAKGLLEESIQPHIEQMPRRWDCVVTQQPDRFMPSYQALVRALPDIFGAWDVKTGELVVDMTGATPAMAASVTLACLPLCSRLISIVETGEDGDPIAVDGAARRWVQANPWDEAATVARRDASGLFNKGAFGAAATAFRQMEGRVSGGQKPLYRALSDLSEGYEAWERVQYRPAWEKLKSAHKALEMASMWGGPPGLKGLLPSVKHNIGFLEKLVLDPQEVKELLAYDLLAHARRRADDHHVELAMLALLRALEACAQQRLWKHHRIKSWDVRPEQLPHALQDVCRTCYLDDIDGKYKLPLPAQFRTLAGLGDTVGQAYAAQWAKMKPLLDAAHSGIFGHGFEPVKAERFQQLYEIVVKITGIEHMMLPKFPVLTL